MAFLLLRIPLAAEVEGAALAVGHLTANLLVSDCTFGEILHSLVKKKDNQQTGIPVHTVSCNTGAL